MVDPMDLTPVFERINRESFDGFLDAPQLVWNSRLRSSAGRFIPGRRTVYFKYPAVIEVASYLREEIQAVDLISDTMAHEMIHYWLWVRRKPYGHTTEFLSKMRAMGVSRYNPVPRKRPYKYLYRCPHCGKDFPAKRKLVALACGDCCKKHTRGLFDERFQLELQQVFTPEQGLSFRKSMQSSPQKV
jgi:predicted SprT family Zn-dependent metalloprotease